MTAAVEQVTALVAGAEVAPGYRVVDHLSRGRVFDVYDVWSDERLARCVAKTLRPDRLDDPSARRGLEREARLLRRLSHPHLVRAYEFLREPRPVALLETLTGATLAHLIDDGVELTAAEVAMLGLHLCSAVGYLHGHGYLHLDLKPSNIVAEAGRAKVIDLSIARRPGRVPPGTGTWCYLAPEQSAGDAVGPAADVWGIGVVLYEAATGLPAFAAAGPTGATGDSEDALPAGPLPEEGPAPRLPANGRLPSALRRAVDACLVREPERRPDVAELWAALERVPGAPSPRLARGGPAVPPADPP